MNKIQFWILSLTWGLLCSIGGVVIALILSLVKIRHFKYNNSYVFIIGKNWGGFTLGPIILVSENYNNHTLAHEFGHSLQNCFFGPFMILVTLASGLRYWYRIFMKKYFPRYPLPEYDAIWFEGMATSLGYKFNGFI